MAVVVYFSYDGLLDPLGQSQIIPYISAISAAGHTLTVVSYEKFGRSAKQIEHLEQQLLRMGVSWERLKFRSGKFWAVKRLLAGIILMRKLCKNLQPDFVHLRGLLPAIIYQLSCSSTPSLYDFRGFALGEWVDIGKLSKKSITYHFLNFLDHQAVKKASGLVVLEDSAKALLKDTYEVPNVPLKVIRTCTDTQRYKADDIKKNNQNSDLRLVFLGGAKFPYRPDLALALVEKINEYGVDCTLDFINEGDHDIIKQAIDQTTISTEKLRVLSCEHSQIPKILPKYDCGLVMVESSPWRRVCSPTKTGEYLSSGLPVISLKGIDALDELSQRTDCVRLVSAKDLMERFQNNELQKIISVIRSNDIAQKAKILAKKEFDLEEASRLYTELYSEIEMQIKK